MNILMCDIALRQHADEFPPVACTSLCNALMREGYRPIFYDIDAKRPNLDDLNRYFEKGRYDIVGISAVVSTGYEYTKKLVGIIKKASPETQIVLGGNLAAAHEVILRKCQVDVCVIGEGERVLLNLVKYYERHHSLRPKDGELHKIKGIAFLEDGGTHHFTGPESSMKSEEIGDVDYDLIGRFSDINQYIVNPLTSSDFADDPRSYEKHRQGKKKATVLTGRGCVNRCTFCHRWVKGYRVFSVQRVIAIMKNLIDKYNVGFFCFSDECYGENKKWLDDFIESVRSLDILFQIMGARVSIIKHDPSIIRKLREVGLTSINYGMESGSDRILKIMEKNATSSDNLKVAHLCAQAGVFTTIQLVIGMPGENDDTIQETIDFVNKATGDLSYLPKLSVNYLQALPGTPTYEYLKMQGLIGPRIEDEEEYLLRISNTNAAGFRHYINVSEVPLSRVMLWKKKIVISSTINWLKKHGWKSSHGHYQDQHGKTLFLSKIKFFIKKSVVTYKIIHLCGDQFWKMIRLVNLYSLYGLKKMLMILFCFVEEDKRSKFTIPEDASLRRVLKNFNEGNGAGKDHFSSQ